MSDDNKIVTVKGANVGVFTLEAGSKTGTYYIKNLTSNSYVGLVSGGTNINTTATDTYISINTNGYAIITLTASGVTWDGSVRKLGFNYNKNSNPRFAHYAALSTTSTTSDSPNPVYLYVLSEQDGTSEGNSYTVTVDEAIEHGEVTVSKSSANEGDVITVTATPATGYELTALSYNDGSDHAITATDGVYSFSMPAGNVTVTATFTKSSTGDDTGTNKYQKVSAIESGKKYIIVPAKYQSAMSATGNAKNEKLLESTNVTFADDIATVTGDDVAVLTITSVDGEYSFVDKDGKYLTLSGGGNVSLGTSEISYEVSLVSDNSGGNYVKIIGPTSTASNRQLLYQVYTTYQSTQTHTGLFGNYAQSNADHADYSQLYLYKQVKVGDYVISYAASENGSVSGPEDADAGDKVELTVTPATNYLVSSVTINGEAITPEAGKYSFVMPVQNVTVAATFERCYTITGVASPTAGGTVTPTPSTATAETRINVTTTTAADYMLSGSPTYNYNGSDHSMSGNATDGWWFVMPNYDVTVNATFVRMPHVFSVVSDHGTVSGLPENATAGTAVSFTVTPESSYTVTTVTVTGEGGTNVSVTAGGDGTYSFTMPSKDVTITVVYFASEDYELLDNISDIKAGETYLLVGIVSSTKKTHVMGGYVSKNSYYDAIEVTPDANDWIRSTEAMNIVNFVPGTGDNAGKWALHTEDGYVTSLSINSSAPEYYSITLNATTHAATIGKFSFNASSPRWKNYDTSQGANYIYKVANANRVKRPVITDALGADNNFIGKDAITITTETEGATIEYSLDGGTTWTAYSGEFEITATAAGDEVTVTARASKDGMETSRTGSATFTCVKPDAPSFGENTAGAYVNPMFVYPKRSTANMQKYGEDAISYYYTLDGTTPAIEEANKVTTKTSNGYYIYVDKDCDLQAVVVINGIASDPAGGEYTFSVAAPAFTLPGGSYDGDQQTRITTDTKTSQNNKSWRTYIYYTTDPTATWEEDNDWVATEDEPTGVLVDDAWTLYDPANPYVNIPAGGTTVLRAVTLSEYMNDKEKFVSSAISTATYKVTAAALAVVYTPAPGDYVNPQQVTLSTLNTVGTAHIFYNITQPDAAFDYLREGDDFSWNDDKGWLEFTGTPITVDHDLTMAVVAIDSRTDDTGTAKRTEDYLIGVQPVQFSPLGAHYLTGETGYTAADYSHRLYSGAQTVEMYSVSPNARVYYTMAEASGTVPPAAPATPAMSAENLYNGTPIALEVGKSYAFTAVAYVGTKPSIARTVYYTIEAADGHLLNIDAMNTATFTVVDAGSSERSSTNFTLSNPFQVVFMSTWRHNDKTPEYAYVRDNSGYGLIYFGNESTGNNGYTKYNMGDWLPGDATTARIAVWKEGFHNEFGSSKKDVSAWPSASIGYTAIMPEVTTTAEIAAGWDATAFDGSHYATGVTENNLWGHYVHLRQATIEVTTSDHSASVTDDKRHKQQGFITDPSGEVLTYYDGFYNFSGYNGTPDYGPTHFKTAQEEGATYGVYGIVTFYGPYATNATQHNQPFEIFPIDFLEIYKPRIYLGGSLAGDQVTVHETQSVSLDCKTVGAQIWYKTSEMEAYELYTGPFDVSSSTTIEAYATRPTKYNDELQSVVTTLELNVGTVEQPVIAPESGVFAIGDEAVDATITCATEGATIWFTVDGTDPKDENGSRMVYNADNLANYLTDIAVTTTVRAIAQEDGYYSTEAESRTYTFVKSNGIEFKLVTNESQLNESNVYVIVNKEYNMALSNVQKENNRAAAGVKFKDDAKTVVYGNADVAMFTLSKTGTNWLFSTSNGATEAANGYLCVGNGNYLRTEAELDAAGNAEAAINIDGDSEHEAHISFLYNSEVDRYLRFWQRDLLFNCYTTESNRPVALYYVEATPLATIEQVGEENKQYTVADELIIVAANIDKGVLWCKDQGNASIVKTAPVDDEQVDFMHWALGNDKKLNKDEWDQSNWIMLQFTDAAFTSTGGGGNLNDYVGMSIKAAQLTGWLRDVVNFTLEVPADKARMDEITADIAEADAYRLNTYCTANFLESNLILEDGDQGAEGDDGNFYYFVNPKIQEVATITWAVWDKNNTFVIPLDADKQNERNFDGAFKVEWDYNEAGDVSADLSATDAYQFKAVVQRRNTAYGPRRIAAKGGQSASESLVVYPLDLTASEEHVVTAVDMVARSREVSDVRYYDIAGHESREPFAGSVNIVVTRYTDGTTTTTKVLK